MLEKEFNLVEAHPELSLQVALQFANSKLRTGTEG